VLFNSYPIGQLLLSSGGVVSMAAAPDVIPELVTAPSVLPPPVVQGSLLLPS